MNSIKKVTRNQVLELINSAPNGLMYSVTFAKKDGTIRTLTSVKGTKKGQNGKGLKYVPSDYGLFVAYDINFAKNHEAKDCYRMITIENISQVKMLKTTFEII